MMMIEESLQKAKVEKREHRRMSLPLTVNFASAPGSHYRVLEVSQQGLRIASNRPLPPGEPVNFDLYLEAGDPFPIRMVARAVWSKKEGDNPVIQGLDLSSSHQRNLNVLKHHLNARG